MTPKELKALLRTCRSEGVAEISIEGVHIKFGDKPSAKPRGKAAARTQDDVLTDGPTMEELAMWSVGAQ